MSMHEITDLLTSSIRLWESEADTLTRARCLTTLARLPDLCQLDAGAPDVSVSPDVQPLHVYAAATATMELAQERQRPELIYAWAAFLLNFLRHMSDGEDYDAASIQDRWFEPMRKALASIGPATQSPPHRTLTLYPEGKDWFDDEHNALIRSFFAERCGIA